jgi:biopolymer transport protein ExbB
VCLSVISIAIMIERSWFLTKNRINVDTLIGSLIDPLSKGRWDEAIKKIEGMKGAVPAVLREGLQNAHAGSRVAEEVMIAQQHVQRKLLSRFIKFLGTVGSNGPFIGLLGTVLGIIRAFKDLAATSEQGPSVVMEGIAEALVSTAIGLLVAIPAVVAFNYLRGWVESIMTDSDRILRLLVAFIESSDGKPGGNESTADKK